MIRSSSAFRTSRRVREDLWHHQRGGRAARGRHGCRRRRVHLRAVRRQIAAGVARDIAQRLPPEILTVGVFRDEARAARRGDRQQRGLAGRAAARPRDARGHPLGPRAGAVRDQGFRRRRPEPRPRRRLRRRRDPHRLAPPGSGEVFDWSLAEGAPDWPPGDLAGGLTPDNVADAIDRVRPWGVDVATGVESRTASRARRTPAR